MRESELKRKSFEDTKKLSNVMQSLGRLDEAQRKWNFCQIMFKI